MLKGLINKDGILEVPSALKKAEKGEKPVTGKATMAKKMKPRRSEDEMRHSRLQKMKNVTPSLGNNNNRTK